MSLIVPVMALVTAALGVAAPIRQVMALEHAHPSAPPFWELALTPGLGGPAAVMTGWLAVVLLALAGRRRGAAALTCIPLTLDLAVVLNLVTQQTGAWSGGLPMFLWTAGGARPSWPA